MLRFFHCKMFSMNICFFRTCQMYVCLDQLSPQVCWCCVDNTQGNLVPHVWYESGVQLWIDWTCNVLWTLWWRSANSKIWWYVGWLVLQGTFFSHHSYYSPLFFSSSLFTMVLFENLVILGWLFQQYSCNWRVLNFK